jgi:cytochrome P450
MLRSRLTNQKDYDDLLGILMHTHHVSGHNTAGFEHVADDVMTFNIVSYITTEPALHWTLVMLAKHPDKEARLSAEVESVCQGSYPTYTDYTKLLYTQAFISEILRLYPSIVYLLRDAVEEDDMMGYKITPQSVHLINLYLLHRHPDYWENPEEFNPERFLKKKWGQDYRYAYVPFGIGKRSCIAKNFAFMELCLVVAMMSQRFKFELPKTSENMPLTVRLATLMTGQPSIPELVIKAK